MPSIDTRRRALAVVVLGAALLAVPALAASPAETYTYRYSATPVGDAARGIDAFAGRGVLDCDREATRLCAFERRVVAEGELRFDRPDLVSVDAPAYEFVRIDGQWYRPASWSEGDAVGVRSEPVERAAVLNATATPVSSLPAVARRAVETGNATVASAEAPIDDVRLVSVDGRYYVLERTAVESRSDPLESVGVWSVPVGFVLVVYGTTRYGVVVSDGEGGRGERRVVGDVAFGPTTRYRLGTAVVALGVLALVVGTTLPLAVQPTYRYEATHVESDEASRYFTDTLDCADLGRPRACLFEREVYGAENRTVAADVEYPGSADERFVRFDEGYFRRTGTVANGTAEIRLTPVAYERVLVEEAEGIRSVAPPARRTVLEGDSVVSDEETYWDGPELVKVNEDYYRVSRERVPSPFDRSDVRRLGRAAFLAVGLACVVAGRREQVLVRDGG